MIEWDIAKCKKCDRVYGELEWEFIQKCWGGECLNCRSKDFLILVRGDDDDDKRFREDAEEISEGYGDCIGE